MTASLKDLYDDLRVAQGAERAKAAHIASHDDPFILKLTNLVLSYAMQVRASDIHLEPTSAGARIRYRIDGLLHEMLQVPQETRDPLLRAIKVKANLATDVVGRSKPQDGRIDFESNGRKVDLRLSSFPTLFGDVLAVRVLDRSAPLIALEQVGFPPTVLKEFDRLIRRPNGMLLVTGPAGSGKTTTLYAALNKLKSPHTKIVTLEDPVEYQVDGIDQAQINSAVGLTFAAGLRAILRQDANIILVGEIRDKETAEIAIRAALTGHLVFSTMHTRNSLGAAARLIEMGIEPHLILAAVNGVIAQRLVRVLCQQCKAPDPTITEAVAALRAKETGTMSSTVVTQQLYKRQGCASCNTTGFHGRTAIFELLVMTEAVKQFILEHGTGGAGRLQARVEGFQSMLANGLDKVAAGVTTLHEVLRVTGDSDDA